MCLERFLKRVSLERRRRLRSFRNDRGTMLVKSHFNAEFAEKEAFLCGRAKADDLRFGGGEDL